MASAFVDSYAAGRSTAPSRDEYVANEEFFDLKSGKYAPAYVFNDASSLANASQLDPGGWITVRNAIDLVARSEPLRNSGGVLETLVAALKSASILGIHGAISRMEVAGEDGGFEVWYEKYFHPVFPYQWATSTSINIHDNSINLADGRPLIDILLNKRDVEDWIEVRSNPNSELLSNSEYEQRAFRRTYQLVNPGDESFVFIKDKGGRGPGFDWANAYLQVMVRHLFIDNRLSERTKKIEIVGMLRQVFTMDGIENGPRETVLKKHANLIWQAFQSAK